MIKKQEKIEITPVTKSMIKVKLTGTSPLVIHNWSSKAIRAMIEKQLGIKLPRPKKDPLQEYKDSLYPCEGGFGFPCTALKAAMIRAAKLAKITMVDVRQMFWVDADADSITTLKVPIDGIEHEFKKTTQIVKIDKGEPQQRMDMVRIGQGIADIRFRGEFLPGWEATATITYLDDLIDASSLLNLAYRAGVHVGICEGRTEKCTLGWGAFDVSSADEK